MTSSKGEKMLMYKKLDEENIYTMYGCILQDIHKCVMINECVIKIRKKIE